MLDGRKLISDFLIELDMTREELDQIFEDKDAEWSGDNAWHGLQIIAKYTDFLLHGANHDVIYSIGVDEVLELGLTKEDAEQLALLNWTIDDDCGCFACFV